MKDLRPFAPPQASSRGSAPQAAPPFPGATTSEPSPSRADTSGRSRDFQPPQLQSAAPAVDLQAMLDAAQQRADALHAEAQTREAALAEGRSRYHGAFCVLEESRQRACAVLARDAVTLGVEIAHALAGRAFELDQEHLVTLVESALAEVSSEQSVHVRVSSADAPHINAHLREHSAHSITVDADPSLDTGDLIVESDKLVIDARVVERIASLREELAATVRSDEFLEDPQEPAPSSEAEDEAR